MSRAKDLPRTRACASANTERRGLLSSGDETPGTSRSPAAATRELLSRYDLRPRKSLGQNFLISDHKLARIAAAAGELADGAPIIEVGPGLGALTVHLARLGSQVVAFELDERLRAPLAETVGPCDAVTIHFQDVLEADLGAAVGHQPFILAGNLPYQITTPLLEKLFGEPGCVGLVITVQREVAVRLRATPASRDYGPLTLFCRYYVDRIETICQLPPGDFIPPPAVASTALKLVRRAAPPFAEPAAEVFLRTVRAAFNQRRKALRAGLMGAPPLNLSREVVAAGLEIAELDGSRRAETLDMAELARLALALQQAAGDG